MNCKDCKFRTVEPNCHNVEICAHWAEHMAKKEQPVAVDRDKVVYEYKKSSKHRYYTSHGKKGR